MANTQFKTQQVGFTLIELMITITLLGVILMMGTSLTRAWIHQSQVNSALKTVQEATTQTKAFALRNTHNTGINEPSASLCLYNSTIKIIYGICPTIEPSDVIQTFELSKGISIKEGTDTFICMEFNYVGVVLPSSTCTHSTNPTLTIGKNNENAEIVIH